MIKNKITILKLMAVALLSLALTTSKSSAMKITKIKRLSRGIITYEYDTTNNMVTVYARNTEGALETVHKEELNGNINGNITEENLIEKANNILITKRIILEGEGGNNGYARIKLKYFIDLNYGKVKYRN